jgi:hypothetical protein
VLVAALAFGALAAVGVNWFLGSRGHLAVGDANPHAAQEIAAPAEAPLPAPRPPSGAVVVPSVPPAPTSAAPEVDLPGATPARSGTPNVVPPEEGAAPGGHAAGAQASQAEGAPAQPRENADRAGTGPGAGSPPVAAPPAAVAAAAAPGAAPEEAAGVAPAVAPPAAAVGARQLSDCRIAFAKNRLREALAACTAAAAANPRSAEALTMLAHTELNRGRLERANELAVRAVAIDPTLADAYVIIGGVHQDSGENKEAKAAYRRYLELAPRGRYADELRSIVNGL